MWNESKSIELSKICVILFMVLQVICMIFAPMLVSRLIYMSVPARAAGNSLFLITIYTGSIPAGFLLAYLYILLHRISKGHVFIKENVTCLRYISWCCFAGAVICTASIYYYLPWFAISIAAAFVGLIVRVVKNVISKAVSLQDESDLTI